MPKTQGLFTPKNKEKYRGDVTKIVYRSSYEFSFMLWCDHNVNVIEWSSEEVIIPYRSRLDELYERKHKLEKQKWHRYFVDFWIKIRDKSGTETRYLVEVKPHHETIRPLIEGTNKSKTTIRRQVQTWIINQAKWAAAETYCKKRNMKFKIITEKELYGKKFD